MNFLELKSDLELQNFEIIKELGTGEYGQVVLVLDKPQKKKFAMKVVPRDKNRGVPPSILKEVGILRDIDHPYIVKLYDVIFSSKYICILYEPADSDLHKFISSRQRLSFKKIRNIMYMILQGLKEIHERCVLHRDLKPSNVLVKKTEKGIKINISDFGLSRMANLPAQELCSEVVSLWYRAPELLLGSTQYDEKIDIWSVGCIFAELMNCSPLFRGKNIGTQCEEILKIIDFKSQEEGLASLKLLPGYAVFQRLGSKIQGKGLRKLCVDDLNFISFISDCLELEPLKRPSAKQALNHVLFAEKDLGNLCIDTLFLNYED